MTIHQTNPLLAKAFLLEGKRFGMLIIVSSIVLVVTSAIFSLLALTELWSIISSMQFTPHQTISALTSIAFAWLTFELGMGLNQRRLFVIPIIEISGSAVIAASAFTWLGLSEVDILGPFESVLFLVFFLYPLWHNKNLFHGPWLKPSPTIALSLLILLFVVSRW